jgi:biotin carboxyl carrier protein
MKMEFRLVSPRAGRVEAVRCKEGDLVEIGAVLVSLAPAVA